jgi:copper chaperone CopZ
VSVEAALRTDGLHCASCIYAVERLGMKIRGVEDIRIDAASGRIHVVYNGESRVIEEIRELVRRLGHSAYPA